MSSFGRGLQPSFSMHFRAIGNWAKSGNMSKWFCGSYREYIPDHYQLGYQITSYANTKFDENVWNKVVRFAVRNPYVIATTWAGLRLVEIQSDGSSRQIKTGRPEIEEKGSELIIKCHPAEGEFTIRCTEQSLNIVFDSDKQWALELTTATGKELPFNQISGDAIKAEFNGHPYSIEAVRGNFVASDNGAYVLRIMPSDSAITIDCNLSR
jgi:hypothetical protein